MAVGCYGNWDNESKALTDTLSMADALSRLLRERVLPKGKTIAIEEVFAAEFHSPEVTAYLAQKKIAAVGKRIIPSASRRQMNPSPWLFLFTLLLFIHCCFGSPFSYHASETKYHTHEN